MVPVKDDGGLNEGDSRGHGGKLTDLGYILETEPTEFVHCMWGEREREKLRKVAVILA